MGLGGIARDSIVGLNKLVHDDENDEPIDRRQHVRRYSGDADSGSGRGSWTVGDGGDGDDFLFLDGDDGASPPERVPSFETSLNDGPTSGPSGVPSAPPGTPRSSAAVAAATSYSKVSATGARSLDSYRPQGNSPANAAQAHYQGFQYEGYTDYYSEDFAAYGYDDYSYGSAGSPRNGGENKKNIFCCLFAPWSQQSKPAIESEDQSVASAEQQGQGEDVDNVNSSAASADGSSSNDVTSSPTPSLKEKIPAATSLGSGLMPAPKTYSEGADPPELPNLLPEAKTPKVSSASEGVSFASPQKSAEEKPTTPHMLAGQMDSDGTALSISPEDSEYFDEKKQEEGDILGHPADEQEEEEEEDEEEEEEALPPIKGILKIRRCSTLSSQNGKKTKVDKDSSLSDSPLSPKRHLFPTYEPKKGHGDGGDDGMPKSINFNPMARVLTIPSRKDIPLHQKAQVWWQRCDYDEFKKTGRIISKAMECGGSEIWLASSNAWGNRAARQGGSNSRAAVDKEGPERSGSEKNDEYNKALSKYVGEEKKDDDEDGDANGNKWWCKFGHSRRGLEHIASNQEGKARQQSVLLAIRMVMEEQRRQRASRTRDPNKLRNVAMQYTSWARDLALAAGSADAEAVASGFDPAAACRARHFARRLNVNSGSLHALRQSDAVGGGVAMAVTSQVLDANTHFTPRTRKSQAKSPKEANVEHDRSEDSLSKRAKGYIPGGGNEIGFRSVKV